MSGEEPVVVETPVPVAAPTLGEPMDIMTALQLVLKKSLAHGGLVRGLHEGAKAIEKHAALLCVLAEDCDQPDYVKLVKALCADHNVNLISVASAKTLGEWAWLLNCACSCARLILKARPGKLSGLLVLS
ncbi:40S ribosomal protein S12-like isoform X1 [Salvia miltiorrhiza]|uniref:40S ribosomal protein S12-like isoform X1 n=1 Tax=Salvia miltiorrhiza TaxID=226208 RepID=UPI0025AC8101|nr:40S ribosomal protein S12-like isoform X1 [Salvia miltiorrhiza]XP_057791363.1 40S ribosomal protein S12-like isoform X1 [Salvia miltiorrhiza]